ncbi:MAG: histidinol-phosphate transaminase [Oscillospiraceae bacterium]|nr:histidinol-phosphate transaminase [Oscillospiraceae bacterium]
MSRFFKLTELEPYVPGEQPANVDQLIKLNTNENPYPPSPRALAAINEEELKKLRLYPSLDAKGLMEAIAVHYGVSTRQICICNSSDETLAFMYHGLCPEGAVFADLTYGFYPVFCHMFGIPYEEIPLREDFTLAVEDYAGKKGTVFITNPNAPTGLFLPLSEIRRLLEQDPNRLVVVDEAYIDFGGETAVPLLKEYDNLLITQTFSKSRALAGGRLGFVIGSEELANDMNTLKYSFNPYNVNRVTMLMGEQAMRDEDYFNKTRTAVMENREWTRQQLCELGFTVTDSRSNFLFAAAPGMSGKEYYAALRDRGILVRYFDKPRTKAYCRITIGTREQMEALLEATRDILKGV